MNWFEWEWPWYFASFYLMPALSLCVIASLIVALRLQSMPPLQRATYRVALPLSVFVFISAVSVWFENPLTAQAPDPDADTVLGTHSAFECAAIAEIAGYADEEKRLREIGFRKGHEVLKALLEERVDRGQLHVPAPSVVLLVYEGPNADFVLGRVYQHALSRVYFEIHRAAGFSDDKSRLQREAQTVYLGRNCPGILLHHDLE